MAEEPKRRLYQGAYRTQVEEDVTTHTNEPTNPDAATGNTSNDGQLTPEEVTWKKRYGDLRSLTNSLTEDVKALRSQLQAAQKKDIQIPSTKEELQVFASKYPDVYRHIRSIAMSELLQERENILQETSAVKDDLEKVKRERGFQRILQAHPDFEELNMSEKFHEWTRMQPKQIQDWLFETPDPDLCIKAIDLYKAETGFKSKRKSTNSGADVLVNTRPSVEMPEQTGSGRIWKASEIGKLSPRQFEKAEAEIEKARAEGRIDPYS